MKLKKLTKGLIAICLVALNAFIAKGQNYNTVTIGNGVAIINGDTISINGGQSNVHMYSSLGKGSLVIINGDTISNSGSNGIVQINVNHNAYKCHPDEEKVDYFYLSVQELETMLKDNPTDSDALCHLGENYISGRLVEKNQSKGLELMHAAADLNNERAICRLGIIYYDGKYGVKKDYGKSAQMILKAEQLNYMSSWTAYYMGVMYSEGKGVEKDLIKAKHYMEIAAKDSMFSDEAQKWLRKHPKL